VEKKYEEKMRQLFHEIHINIGKKNLIKLKEKKEG
jgi:hypothetical protein